MTKSSSSCVCSLNDRRWPTRRHCDIVCEGVAVMYIICWKALLRGRTLGTLTQARPSLVGARLIVTGARTAGVNVTRLVRAAFQNAVAVGKHFLKLQSQYNQPLSVATESAHCSCQHTISVQWHYLSPVMDLVLMWIQHTISVQWWTLYSTCMHNVLSTLLYFTRTHTRSIVISRPTWSSTNLELVAGTITASLVSPINS